MSWSLHTQATTYTVLEKLQDASDASLKAQSLDAWDDDVKGQMNSAFASAALLAEEIGEDGPLNINCYGHARRSENDTVSIGVSLMTAPQTASTTTKKES
jgi:hypothetical protein